MLYVLVALMTGGLLWLLADYIPAQPLWAMRRCHLNDAEHVLVQVGAFCTLSVSLCYLTAGPVRNVSLLATNGRCCRWQTASASWQKSRSILDKLCMGFDLRYRHLLKL